MTVKELIEKLKEIPHDTEVFLPYHEEVNSILFYAETNEVELRAD